MFPVRLILLVFATTLICGDSLGGEPNDRIDQVLAEMVKMNDKVDALTGKVNGMEKTITKQVEKVDSNVLQYITWFFGYKYKFVGKGYDASHSDQVGVGVTTLKECLQWCQKKRTRDGSDWNGVKWYESNGHCSCVKKDRGHEEVSGCLHFRAQ